MIYSHFIDTACCQISPVIHLTTGRIWLEKLVLCQVKLPIHQEQAGSGAACVQVNIFPIPIVLTGPLLFSCMFSRREECQQHCYTASISEKEALWSLPLLHRVMPKLVWRSAQSPYIFYPASRLPRSAQPLHLLQHLFFFFILNTSGVSTLIQTQSKPV